MNQLPDHYSPTSLLRFESCPWSWARHYVDGDRGDESPLFVDGRFKHRIMESYISECARREIELDELLMERIVSEKFAEQTGVPMSSYQDVLDMMLRAARKSRVDWQNFIAVEDEYHMDVDGHDFMGRLDALYIQGNVAHIPDWKSGWAVPSQAEVDNDFKMACYAALVMDPANYPQVNVVRVNITNLRYGITRDAKLKTFEHAEATKHEIAVRIRQIERAAEADDFPATPGSYCAVCEFRGECPRLTEALARAGNKTPPIVSQDQAEYELGQIILLRAAAAAKTERLADWTAVSGPVRAKDHVYGPRVVESTNYPPEAIFRACEGTEIDPYKLLRADRRAVEKAINRNAAFADALAPHAVLEAATRTDLHKVKKQESDDA